MTFGFWPLVALMHEHHFVSHSEPSPGNLRLICFPAKNVRTHLWTNEDFFDILRMFGHQLTGLTIAMLLCGAFDSPPTIISPWAHLLVALSAIIFLPLTGPGNTIGCVAELDDTIGHVA
jgi:hypothetical protein